ncbi:unnamed protein product [Vitrella brassicaformis CCMP3155]|uniref:Uncharacterized protein n=1 Tax=Vitrella brassicaformis (strain CCMP3155) TaxID=1169540 RepID=A0A0G4E9T8_VITBC|nr:unnamed protein product [Vitrella brassicaformis CCMP3155]|eukprot:CEL91961.1 unnamed protein product [Vitrella brassicaformis CCMP3155]
MTTDGRATDKVGVPTCHIEERRGERRFDGVFRWLDTLCRAARTGLSPRIPLIVSPTSSHGGGGQMHRCLHFIFRESLYSSKAAPGHRRLVLPSSGAVVRWGEVSYVAMTPLGEEWVGVVRLFGWTKGESKETNQLVYGGFKLLKRDPNAPPAPHTRRTCRDGPPPAELSYHERVENYERVKARIEMELGIAPPKWQPQTRVVWRHRELHPSPRPTAPQHSYREGEELVDVLRRITRCIADYILYRSGPCINLPMMCRGQGACGEDIKRTTAITSSPVCGMRGLIGGSWGSCIGARVRCTRQVIASVLCLS